MSLLKKLFGGSGPKAPEPESHQGFLIFPDSQAEGGNYRLGARIEKEIGGELKTHLLIRADTFNTADAANEAAVRKAKLLIDQMGERLF
ncbi:HlyU family transcriptional regulator [Cognatishimia activa]|uniref:HlyU family transcriptional regulator n=1 Tax=Cognatishimia activa TaxID=1715691 RepID=UPI00223007C8|nr:HlyU family transcriptional regulator [Cognatishimia activa]UZD91746.1 HlyU family transcriptional regulator [Cognatishimia activa]